MVLIQRLLLSLFVCLSMSAAHADVLFEGFSKVLSGSTHTGYIIQRFELDKKTGNFIAISYTRTGPQGGDLTESLKAVATKGLEPISYSYTSTIGKEVKTIDATFKKGKMVAKVTRGANTQTIEKAVEKGTFLSSFLIYLMLQSQDGLKKGTKYTYKAIAEEDPEIAQGESFIEGQETHKDQSAFRVLNTFKGTKFVSYVTPNGEILATKSPVQGVATELVAKSQDAVADLPFNQNSLKILFGAVPKGEHNVLAKAAAKAAPIPAAAEPPADAPATEPAPEAAAEPKAKGAGVPGGQGIHLKQGGK